jgi:phage terminase small subunit
MTERQERFCQEYSKLGNATQSAINAGYSERSAKQVGQRLLTNDDIKQRIRELQGEIKNQNIADAREMQSILTSIIRSESEEEVIVVEGIGDGCSEGVKHKKKPSQSDRIKAINLLAKMQGVLDNSMTLNVVIPVFGGEEDLED